MTPLQIEIMLHYHSRPYDYRDGDFSAPAVREAIDGFREFGLLVVSTERAHGDSRSYVLSAGGRIYVETLMDVPHPHKEWALRWKGVERHALPDSLAKAGGGEVA